MSVDLKKRVIEAESAEILNLSKTVDFQVVESIETDVSKKGVNIFFTGCGTSAMAAQKIVHTFRVINLSAFYLNPSDAVHGALGAIHSNDIVFFISKGGNTKELVSFVDNITDKGAQIIVVTEDVNSLLVTKADRILKIKVEREPDKYNMLATASTLAVIAVFDAMAIDLMYRMNYSENVFFQNHPSGAVGEKLKEDLKHE